MSVTPAQWVARQASTVYLVEDIHGMNVVVIFAHRKDAEAYVARGLGYELPMRYTISPFTVWSSLEEMDRECP